MGDVASSSSGRVPGPYTGPYRPGSWDLHGEPVIQLPLSLVSMNLVWDIGQKRNLATLRRGVVGYHPRLRRPRTSFRIRDEGDQSEEQLTEFHSPPSEHLEKESS